MPYLLALDQGTTSSRSIVFRADGTIAGIGQREFEQHYPKPGWVEHDPQEIWSTQAGTISEAIADAGIGPEDIAALGITNQRETVIVWDRATGKPIAPAIVWQDRRTADACRELREAGQEAFIRDRTGLVIDPYFSATKVAWLLDNTPGARERAERGELCFGTVDTWLIWKLTRGERFVTDASNASRTMLFNIHTLEWDQQLLDLFGIPRSMLAEVVPSAGVIGTVASGLPAAGRPIAAIAGDQQAATVGQGCDRPGLAKNTYGTGCFLLMNTGDEPKPSEHRLLTTVGWTAGGQTSYCLEGSVFVAGAIVQWLRDGLGLIEQAADIEPLARSVEDSGGVCLVPALTGLGAPHWDADARGAILGLTRGTTAAHIARAALEGIACSVADLLDAIRADAGEPVTELRVDGGASANALLMQTQADLVRTPVVVSGMPEATAFGAARLAGLAAGVYRTLSEAAGGAASETRYEPRLADEQVAEIRARWHKGVRRSRSWI